MQISIPLFDAEAADLDTTVGRISEHLHDMGYSYDDMDILSDELSGTVPNADLKKAVKNAMRIANRTRETAMAAMDQVIKIFVSTLAEKHSLKKIEGWMLALEDLDEE